MNTETKELALIFKKKHAVKFKKKGYRFNLHNEHPEAPLSPNYMNLRDVIRDVGIRRKMANLLVHVINSLQPDRLVDLPQSISPLVTTLSDMTGINMISIRSEALKTVKGKQGKKKHGISKPIMGRYRKGERVLIIDDVVASMAHTKEKAIQALRKEGLEVIRVICVVVDREEGGKEMLGKLGYDLFCILGFKKMLKLYLEKGSIDEDYYKKSLAYSRAAKKFSLSEQ